MLAVIKNGSGNCLGNEKERNQPMVDINDNPSIITGETMPY